MTFYVLPFADAVTGFLVLNGMVAEASAGSLSQLLRALLLFPGLALVPGPRVQVVVLAVLYMLCLEASLFVLHQQTSWLVIGTIYDFKLVYLLIAYFALKSVDRRTMRSASNYFVHGASIYGCILILTTLAGVHTPTYDEGNFGSKGVFASGNALSLYLGCASLIALQAHWNAPGKTSLPEAVFLLLSALLVGTKASLIFFILFLVLLFYRAKLPTRLIILFLAALMALAFLRQFGELFSLIFDVIVFRFENSDSLFSFLASGRDVYISEALQEFQYEGWFMPRLIFGTGPFISFRPPNGILTEYDTLESDLFDIFFSYGLIGTGCYLALVIYGLILGLRAAQPALLCAWIGTCIYSAMAGHVSFNAMSGMAFPVILVAMQRATLKRRRHD